jgi:hypothetical protein
MKEGGKIHAWIENYNMYIVMGFGLDSQGLIPSIAGDFSVLHNVHTSPGTHPAFYPMGTRSYFPVVKGTRA